MSITKHRYVATAIPYVNSKGHIGNAMDFIIADTLARYYRGQGYTVLMEQGADEHGSKNYKKSQELGIETQDFVDKITEQFKEIHVALNIKYDKFIRTTSSEHKKSATAVWKQLLKGEDIYKAIYKGYYCVGCESFKTKNEFKETGGICPNHQQPYEELEEENYFLRLSKYSEAIIAVIEDGTFNVTPESRKNEILATLRSGLEDISISRPKKKLPWGIEVPGDSDHVMYVWFEALINYISVLGYPDSDVFDAYWPAHVQIIGKDILRHHAAIWPAMLMGVGLHMPKNLYVHGHITSNGVKMSKTLGNVIDPIETSKEYGADAFRYYILRHIPSDDDGDFTFERFESAYNNELGNDLGNLVQRVASMIQSYQSGVIGDVPVAEHDVAQYHLAMEAFQFDKALDYAWSLINGLNQYIEAEKPWKIAKENDAGHLQEVLSYLVSSILQQADLLEPFMPQTSEKIRTILGGLRIDQTAGVLFPKINNYTKL